MKKILILFMTIMIFNTGMVFANDMRFSVDNSEPGKLSTIIYGMAKKTGMDAAINPKVDGIVLLSFQDKTITEAMDILGSAYGFGWYIENNTIVVSPTDTMITQSKRFPLRFADPEFVKKEIQLFVQEKSIAINPEDSSVVVDGSQVQLKKVEDKIKQIDVAPQQILVQAQIVEISKTDQYDFGLKHSWGDYSNKAASPTLDYAVTASASEIIGKGKLIASPSVLTLNGREAVFKMGSKVPVLINTVANDGTKSTSVDYKDVGYYITATPRINNSGQEDEYVTMKLEPQISSISGWISNGNTKAPQISTREAKTNVRVKSGETIIIGGLIKDEELKTLTEIPILSKIPLLGALFKNRTVSGEKNEIYVFVTPTIIKSPKTVIAPVIDTTSLKGMLNTSAPNPPSLLQDTSVNNEGKEQNNASEK